LVAFGLGAGQGRSGPGVWLGDIEGQSHPWTEYSLIIRDEFVTKKRTDKVERAGTSRVKRVRKPVSGLAGLGHGGHGSASASAPCENERSGIGRGKAASAASYAASSPASDARRPREWRRPRERRLRARRPRERRLWARQPREHAGLGGSSHGLTVLRSDTMGSPASGSLASGVATASIFFFTRGRNVKSA
jgi:hypothetical protein